MIDGRGFLFTGSDIKKRRYNTLEHEPLTDDQIRMLKSITVWGDQANIVFGLLRTIDELRGITETKSLISKGSHNPYLQQIRN